MLRVNDKHAGWPKKRTLFCTPQLDTR